jgi:beta-glucanase (GH16 family)
MTKLLVTASALVSYTLGYDYISGEVKSLEVFTYGKFVTSLRTDDNNGIVASFYTFWDGPDWSDGQWNEIDFEVVPSMVSLGEEPASTNLIYGNGDTYHNQE